METLAHGKPYAVHDPPQQRSFFSTFLWRFLMAMVAAFALMAIISLTVKLVFKQRYPEILVVSGSGTLRTSRYGLTAKWDVMCVVKNPNNKFTIHYDAISAGITHGKFGILDSRHYKPFVQGSRAQNAVGLGFAAKDVFLGKEEILRIRDDMSRGAVRFGLRLSGWVRFKNHIIKSRYHFWESVCDPLMFDFSATKNFSLTLTNPVTCK
ncbi:uncharacterized protein LOC107471419 [Arachis duranensis]|uniref:Uncharacterized protein LOC107471419 n=1 Tax=Arachis duranensis TaxID=130453 RepID=A0A6P4BZ36_ARADU|nr:uncharacterized protein LOC107471419 [Arachis duranensis]